MDKKTLNQDEKYCSSCGEIIKKEAEICVKCGVRQHAAQPQYAVPHNGNIMQQVPSQPKGRTAFVLLGIFLGALGIHNFYAGYQGKAIAQLLISLLSFGFLSPVSWVWAIIEVCTVKTDSNNNVMV